ncbi:MAG: fibronectin type III domain-containing protein [Defluviicoccus sp.]|nr:fibronectin type III domain-containing protein [Defluviicoccus sp.]
MFAFVVAFLPVIGAQAQGLTVPSAPQDVVATAEDGGVVLRWSAPESNGGSAILRYEVRSAEGASVPESADWTSNGTFTSLAFRQLTHGTQYSFEVRAVNAQGAGPAVQVQATPDKTPSVPRGLTATPGDGEVVLRWSPPADNGGFDVVYYSFRGAEGASVPWNTPWRTTSETSGTLRQLTNGTLYTFEVRAENAQGAGRPAQIQATPEGTVPSAPRDVVATAEDGGVVLKWSPPADSGSSIVTRYEMRGAAGASVPESTPWISTGTRRSGALRQLTNGTLYTFEVRAVNKNGGGPAAEVQATPGLAPSAPRNLEATPGHGQVTLEWDAPADRGSTAITDYELRYAEGTAVPSETAWNALGPDGTDRFVAVDHLTNGRAYAFEVRAVNASGAGDAAAVTATPVQHPTVTVRPEQAAYRFAEGASETGVVIVAQGEPGGDRPLDAFRVAVTASGVTGGATFPSDVEPLAVMIDIDPEDFTATGGIWQASKSVSLSIVDDALDEDDEEFQVKVGRSVFKPPWLLFREADGRTACGEDDCVVTITIEDNDRAPSAPRNLMATAEDGGIVLRWSPPASNGGSNVTRYETRGAAGASVPESTPWVSTGTRTSGAFRQLTNGTLYSFEVRAVNARGAGPAARIQATPGAPTVPQDVIATAEDGGIVLRWSAPANSYGSAIRRYETRGAAGASVPESTPWISTGTRTSGAFRQLTNGTLYSFEVRAVNARGAGPAARVQATPGLAPSAPRNLEAEPGDRAVTLEWQTPSSNGGSPVTGYEYRHAEGSSVADETAWTSVGTALTVTIGSLVNGTGYAFEVRAVNAVGGGEIAALTATPAVAPSAPRNLEAEPGDGAVTLKWQAPSSNGGSPVTGYEYRHAEGSSVADETAWTSAGTALTVTVESLVNDTQYAFEVRAENAVGKGEIAALTATPAVQATVPSAPRSLEAEPGDGAVTLEWQAPSSNGGSPVTGYEYRHSEGSTVADETAWTSVGTALTVTVGSLTNDTQYAFEVRAVNAVGGGEIAALSATPAVAPSAPRNLEAEAGDGAVTLKWQAPANNGGSAVTGYEYRHAEGSTVADETAWTSIGTTLTVTVGSLVNGTGYAFEVRAVNVVGGGEVAALTATPAVAPSAPQSLEAEPGDGEVKLTWAAPSSNGGSPVTGYEYRHAEGSTVADETAWTSVGTALTVTIGSLTNDTQYAFEVRAVNAVGEGSAATLTATPVQHPTVTVRPEQAAYRFVEGASGAGVAIAAQGEPGGGRPNETFRVTVSSKPIEGGAESPDDYGPLSETISFSPEDFTAAGGIWQARKTVALAIVDDALDEDDEDLTVALEMSAGLQSWVRLREADGRTACGTDGCIAKVTIEDNDRAPSAPRNLMATRGDGAVTLEWQAPADPGTLAVTGYEYRHAEGTTVPDETGWTSADAALSVEIGGLIEGTVYTFQVRAVSDAGGGEIAALTATPAVAPSAPQNLEAEPGDGEVKLTWAAPASNGGSAVTGYEYRHAEGSSVADETEWTSVGTDLTVTIGSLVNDTQYTFEVRAANVVGGGEIAALTATPAVFDNDGPAANGLAITPVPPAASADHGPYYTKDDFLALPEGAVHGTGATLTFTLTLDTEVTVTGSPELVLDIHDRERRARYTGGSGTRQLTFVWTVAKGDNDPDGLEVVSLDLKGGTIRDSEERDLVLDSVASHSFPEHRVRGGLFAMRLEATGSAREGEPFEIRVIRDGGYDEPAVAVAGVTDSALPHIPQRSSPALNGPGVRQFDFQDGEPGEPGVRVSTGTVTPLGDGVADGERTLTVRLTATDAGIHRHTGQSIQAWYLVEEPLEVTVPVIDTGQPLAEAGLQVHDTSATEAPGAKLVFRVTLSPRSEGTVTVGYRTGDNPPNARGATAGQDYVPTEGMLTFEPGDTLKTVEVEVLPDDHDDRLETMRLILSNAQGARIDKAVGRGIIRNDGPIPRAWLARFGRTVADQVLDAVESRMEAARQPGVEMTLAGQRVGGEEGRTPEPETAVRLSDKPRAVRGATSRDLLSGTSFTATAETGRGGYVSLWGRGAVTRFDGREGSLTLDGEVASAMAGVDWAHENWTAGLIVSRSVAEGGYTGHSGGRVEATLTGLYPWGRIALSDRVDGWGAAGYGTGELSVTPRKPGTAEDAATVRTDLDLRMAAAGLRGDLVDGGGDGLTLTAKTDASIVETASDAARGPGGGSLAAASASVTRLRLGLEGSRPIPLGGGEALIPSAEIGARHDGGDAETGFGVDLGGGLAWTAPGRGLRIELRGRGLLAHEERGFRERGFSGSLAWDPAPSSESGPKATVAQTVGGPASGGADTLLARGTLAGLGASPGADGGGDLGTRRLEAKFGYGFATRGGRFASVPEIGLGLSDSGRDFSLGWRLVPDGAGGPGTFQLSAEARRHETDGGDRPPEHSIGLRLSARW